MIGIIGLGNFGVALADLFSKAGLKVIAWTNDSAACQHIFTTNQHPKYFSEYTLDKNLVVTTNKKDLENCEIILLAVPSKALGEILASFEFKPEQIIVSLIKGFEKNSLLIPLEYIKSIHPELKKLAVLSGPSFAKDLIDGKPTGLVCASESMEVSKYLTETLSVKNLRLYMSEDPIGVQLGGILKNIIAVAVGINDQLGYAESTRAMLITRGLAEITRTAVALGAKFETLYGLSGVGDLILTSTSNLSRNRQFGVLLAQGYSVKEAEEKVGSTIEAVQTIPLVLQIAEKHSLTAPISESIYSVINGKIKVEDLYGKLFNRPVRAEH